MLATKKLREFEYRVRRRLERTLLPLGKRVDCPYCHWTGFRFMSAGPTFEPNRLCPGCASLERHRMLPLVLARELAGRHDVRVIDLAPRACFKELCLRQSGWRYVSSDLASPTAQVRADLRQMPFASDTFDLLVCFHVMEHVADDGLAFAEIARVLRPGGIGVICVPLGGATTLEGAPEADWERLYGQYDHVRLYGSDIEQRMQASGLAVRRIDTLQYFRPDELARYALRGEDRYLFFVSKAP